MEDPPVIPGQTGLHQSTLYPCTPEFGSRRPVEAGAEARGMKTPPLDSGINEVDVDLFALQETTHCISPSDIHLR